MDYYKRLENSPVQKKQQRTTKENLLNKPTKQSRRILPIAITYNRTLPNINSIVEKHCHVLQVKSKFKKIIFQDPPVKAYLREIQIIWSNSYWAQLKKKKKKNQTKKNCGKCSACLSNGRTLCCKQVVGTILFKSTHSKREFDIFHKITCKNKWIIDYLPIRM